MFTVYRMLKIGAEKASVFVYENLPSSVNSEAQNLNMLFTHTGHGGGAVGQESLVN